MADVEAATGLERRDQGDLAEVESGAPKPDEPDAVDRLDPGAQRFVEGMGLYYERLGVPRIGGRILGLLMIAERPLTLDDMARALKVSRASISTNARMNVAVGMVEHVSLAGDRRDYYVFSPNAWTRRLEVALPFYDILRQLSEQGMKALDPDNTMGRDRLRMAIEFCDFGRRESEEMIARWKRRIAGKPDGAHHREG